MCVCVYVALLQEEGGETLLLSVRNLGCSCAIEKQPVPRSVSWIRRIPCAQVNTQFLWSLSFFAFRHKENTDRCIVLKLKFLNILKNVVYGKILDPKLFTKCLVEALFSLWSSRISCKLCRIMRTTALLETFIANKMHFKL